ncbi:MAG: hypothetical protein HQ582_17860 [Planctomycetes bacterium]|nr:hypothetical protein [Planctomycetota bacterium]
MLVRCIVNDLDFLDSDTVVRRLRRSFHLEGPISDLAVGREYEVHALELRDGGIWFFLQTVAVSDCPYPYPAEFFEVIDGAIPPSWAITFGHDIEGTRLRRLAFAEWATDDQFYERLVDEDAACIALYRKHSATQD